MDWDEYKTQIKQALDLFTFDNQILELLKNSRANKQTIFIAGNGGSASLADHYATDFSKGANKEWKNISFPRFKAISLSSNTGYITAIANDESYQDIFKQQLANLASKNDIGVFISSSGNSPNIVSVAEFAKSLEMITVGITGFQGGKLKQIADYSAHINFPSYGVCEDIHSIFGHFLTEYLKGV